MYNAQHSAKYGMFLAKGKHSSLRYGFETQNVSCEDAALSYNENDSCKQSLNHTHLYTSPYSVFLIASYILRRKIRVLGKGYIYREREYIVYVLGIY